jgi:hypothetical protein
MDHTVNLRYYNKRILILYDDISPTENPDFIYGRSYCFSLSVHTNNSAVTLCDLNYLLEVGDILKYSSSNNTDEHCNRISI